jgi:hypothetical protein
MELVYEVETIGMVAAGVWLNETLEKELDLGCTNVKLGAKMVIVGQFLAHIVQNFPINLGITPEYRR